MNTKKLRLHSFRSLIVQENNFTGACLCFFLFFEPAEQMNKIPNPPFHYLVFNSSEKQQQQKY